MISKKQGASPQARETREVKLSFAKIPAVRLAIIKTKHRKHNIFLFSLAIDIFL